MKTVISTLLALTIIWALPFLINYGCSAQSTNHVRSFSTLTEEVTIDDLEDREKVRVTTQYVDGLGREIQTVQKQASPSDFDLVVITEYDEQGRPFKSYLPFALDQHDGSFVSDATGKQAVFYNQNDHDIGENVVEDEAPYSRTQYEPSPLNRVAKQGYPGTQWQPSGTNDLDDKTTKFRYELNGEGEVLDWEFDYDTKSVQSNPAYFEVNQLFKNITFDENNRQVIEYVDLQEQVVLKRVQAHENGAEESWADTYYVYDDFGSLRLVLPPMIFVEDPLSQENAAPSIEERISQYAFFYDYDHRRRLITKVVPGADPVEMVYDYWDRLVLTQDGDQRERREWLFTKYDALNRPVMTGIASDDQVLENEQETLEELRARLMTISIEDKRAEVKDASDIFNYTYDKSFPESVSKADLLTVTYYDNYDFIKEGWDAEGSSFGEDSNCDCLPVVRGQVTGGMVRVFNTKKVFNAKEERWLNSVTYYDDRYRIVKTYSENWYGVDDTANEYDFIGNLEFSDTSHQGSDEFHIERTYDYDHADRLISISHSSAESTPITILFNHYNEIGELIAKDLHATVEDNILTGSHQRVDYTYNVRGWLKTLGQGLIVEMPTTPEPSLFGMELIYHTDSN